MFSVIGTVDLLYHAPDDSYVYAFDWKIGIII